MMHCRRVDLPGGRQLSFAEAEGAWMTLERLLNRLKCAFRGHHWAKSRTRTGFSKCVRCGKRVPTEQAL